MRLTKLNCNTKHKRLSNILYSNARVRKESDHNRRAASPKNPTPGDRKFLPLQTYLLNSKSCSLYKNYD